MANNNEYIGISNDSWYTSVADEDLLAKIVEDNSLEAGKRTETLQFITRGDIEVLINGRTKFYPAGTVETITEEEGYVDSFVTVTADIEVILSASF